jgi:hypothetical protein
VHRGHSAHSPPAEPAPPASDSTVGCAAGPRGATTRAGMIPRLVPLLVPLRITPSGLVVARHEIAPDHDPFAATMRRLVPVMAALPGQLNLLTAEAVGAAVVLGARIAVSTASPLLTAAASSVDVIVDSSLSTDSTKSGIAVTAPARPATVRTSHPSLGYHRCANECCGEPRCASGRPLVGRRAGHTKIAGNLADADPAGVRSDPDELARPSPPVRVLPASRSPLLPSPRPLATEPRYVPMRIIPLHRVHAERCQILHAGVDRECVGAQGGVSSSRLSSMMAD